MSKLELEFTKPFKKDFKRVCQQTPKIKNTLEDVIKKLQNRLHLEAKYQDHALKGSLKGIRDCHIRGDLILLYAIREPKLLLLRLGSHSQLNL